MPLDVAFYSDALTSGQYGLGRYARELFRELNTVAPDINLRPVSAHVTQTAESQALAAEHGCVRLPYPRKIVAGLWSSVGWPRLEHWTPWAEVVHCVELDYRVATRKPLVVTIHDIGPLTHPEFFRNSHPWLLSIALKSAIARASAIICVSHATADAVESHTKCSLGDRLAIIPEGVSEEFFQSGIRSPFGVHASACPAASDTLKGGYQTLRTRQQENCASPLQDSGDPSTHRPFSLEAPYFLWAGSLNPRKNLSRVVEAFEQVAPEIPHHLVLAGGLGWDSDETLRRIQGSPAGARIHLPGRVSDEELRGLYRGASGFVYVSLMEGFGLPILEAMACGCPVITSNLSSMPEVAGDAAFLVNPLDVNEIGEAMHCIATDHTFAKHLSIRGRSRAEEFHWDACALSVAEIYHRVAKKPGKSKRGGTLPPGSHAQPKESGVIQKEELCVKASAVESSA